MDLVDFVARLAAWAAGIVIRVVLRCITMAVSNRFRAASLSDIELYTQLWLMSEASNVYRAIGDLIGTSRSATSAKEMVDGALAAAGNSAVTPIQLPSASTRVPPSDSTPTAPSSKGTAKQVHQRPGGAASGRTTPAGLPLAPTRPPTSGSGVAATKSPDAASTPRAPPISITETLRYFKRVPVVGSTTPPRNASGVFSSSSPDLHGMVPPSTFGRRPPGTAILVYIKVAGRRDAEDEARQQLLRVVADAVEMDYAELTVCGVRDFAGSPRLEEALDSIVSDIGELAIHCGHLGSMASAVPGMPSRATGKLESGSSLSSTPTPGGTSAGAPPPACRAAAPLSGAFARGKHDHHHQAGAGGSGQHELFIAGFGYGATLAMLAVARRSAALAGCAGLLAMDPIVGWQASRHHRRVSFHDDSFGSNTSDSGASHAPAVINTPKRGTAPRAVHASHGDGAPDRLWRRPNQTLTQRGGSFIRDVLQTAGAELNRSCRRDLCHRHLRQWMPASQWSNNGSEAPLFVVIDPTSLWLGDQVDFINRWQKNGDDVEWCAWSSAVLSATPSSGTVSSTTADGATPKVHPNDSAAPWPQSGAALRHVLQRPRSFSSFTNPHRRSTDSPLPTATMMQTIAQWLSSTNVYVGTPSMSMGHRTPFGAAEGHVLAPPGARAPQFVTRHGTGAFDGLPAPPGMPAALPAPMIHRPTRHSRAGGPPVPLSFGDSTSSVPWGDHADGEGNSLVSDLDGVAPFHADRTSSSS